MPKTLHDPPFIELPVYWFLKLESAIEKGDYQAAADAQRELARLGVRVSFNRPSAVALKGVPYAH
jgi:hypothetical protein